MCEISKNSSIVVKTVYEVSKIVDKPYKTKAFSTRIVVVGNVTFINLQKLIIKSILKVC